MKKSVKCVARTINLAQPKTCPRSPQVQKLISADVASPCPESIQTPYKTSCRSVPIRICTRRDMERTLPPQVCECPQKLPPETFGIKLYRSVNNIVKAGIFAGLVYWTSAEGFWGDAQESEGLYRRIMFTISPVFEEVVDLRDVKPPHFENVKHAMLDAYNRSVLGIVGLAIGVPVIIEEKIYDVLFPCNPTDEHQPIESGGIKNNKKVVK